MFRKSSTRAFMPLCGLDVHSGVEGLSSKAGRRALRGQPLCTAISQTAH